MGTNDPQQQSMIREAMKSIAERRPGRTKLVYDKTKRTIVAVAEGTAIPTALNITAEDADMFAVLSLSAKWIRAHWKDLSAAGGMKLELVTWDEGDAYTHQELGVHSTGQRTQAVASVAGKGEEHCPTPIGVSFRQLESPASLRDCEFEGPNGVRYLAQAWKSNADAKEPMDIEVVEVVSALDARRKGLIENNVLSQSSVLCIGLGTGGAYIATELAKCGVGRFVLVDHDRLSAGNVVRHPGGLSEIGRLKVNVLRDLLLEKNPDVHVTRHPISVSPESESAIRELIQAADVVVCGTDNRLSKLLINKLCLEANTVALYGGAFRRAYGGQVLRVRPHVSPCHQCFISAMPEEAGDVEIGSQASADEIAYSDRRVPVEPGLSLDVLPIANMVAKLVLLELLKDKESTLNVLQRDFEAPWYLWLNRPEAGTKYSDWPPLSESMQEMTINRWYGINFERDSGCPACGDFTTASAVAYGIDPSTLADIPSAPSPI